MFNRVPNRQEKEPMRNLYMYYKRLKGFIDKKQAAQKKGGSGPEEAQPNQRQGGSRASSVNTAGSYNVSDQENDMGGNLNM